MDFPDEPEQFFKRVASKDPIRTIVPSVFEITPRGEITINVFTRLLKDRIIWLSDQIDKEVANVIMAQLLYLDNQNHNDIYMYLNCPGGSVVNGLGIYDAMQFVKSDIVTICAAECSSMATYLLCAGAKGKRFAFSNATIMQHPIKDWYYGTNPDLQIQARRTHELQERLYQIMAKHTGQTVKRVAKDFERDRYFTPEEAKEYGIIDEVLEKNPM
jgi:ATP-dependent Clp protease, protease subunit